VYLEKHVEDAAIGSGYLERYAPVTHQFVRFDPVSKNLSLAVFDRTELRGDSALVMSAECLKNY
jgi:hypothetical protein